MMLGSDVSKLSATAADAAARGLSIVVPVYNEAAGLNLLHRQLGTLAAHLRQRFHLACEVVYVDDGVILRSQANLVASRNADWSIEARETARIILDHIAARARANKYREVRTRFAGCNDALLTEAHNRFGVVSPFGGPSSSGMLTLHCPPNQLYALGSFLRAHGADTVSVASLDYVLDRENPLFARLEAFLSR